MATRQPSPVNETSITFGLRFDDIKPAYTIFNGDGTCNIEEWITQFEEIYQKFTNS